MTRIGRSRHGLAAAVRGGVLYFGAVFALGFAFAIVRDGVLELDAAKATRLQAALVEIPLLLAAAWFACSMIVRRLDVPLTGGAQVLMGIKAFALIILAEAATGMLLLGRTLEAHLATYLIPSHAAGLAGQMVFATFPWVQGPRSGRTPQASKVTDGGTAAAHRPLRMAGQARRGGRMTVHETEPRRTFTEEIEVAGHQLVTRVKELVAEGKVRKLRIKELGRHRGGRRGPRTGSRLP